MQLYLNRRCSLRSYFLDLLANIKIPFLFCFQSSPCRVVNTSHSIIPFPGPTLVSFIKFAHDGIFVLACRSVISPDKTLETTSVSTIVMIPQTLEAIALNAMDTPECVWNNKHWMFLLVSSDIKEVKDVECGCVRTVSSNQLEFRYVSSSSLAITWPCKLLWLACLKSKKRVFAFVFSENYEMIVVAKLRK